MSDFAKTATEIIICFFACVGIITILRELSLYLTKGNRKSQVTVILNLTASLSPIDELISFASFYNNSYASRYLDKIVIQTDDNELLNNKYKLCQALNLPLLFENATDKKEGYNDRNFKHNE